MKKYYKIKEIADLYGIAPDSLRYYEEVGLISPKRSASNYRLYSLSDIWVLNVIRDCLQLGYDTKQIKEYLSHRTVDTTQQFLEDEKCIIEKQIHHLQRQLSGIQRRRADIVTALAVPCDVFAITTLPERRCSYLKEHIESDEEVDFLLTKLSGKLPQHSSVIGNLNSGSMVELFEDGFHYTSVFMMNTDGKTADFILPKGTYCTYTYRGSYAQSFPVMRDMIVWLKEKGYQPQGSFMEFLLIDVHETAREEEYITQIQIRALPYTST